MSALDEMHEQEVVRLNRTIKELQAELQAKTKECDELLAQVEKINKIITDLKSLAAHDNEVIDACIAICEKVNSQPKTDPQSTEK